ncbi:MAG: orotidine-5'-phosphate decarboxylase [Actinobacteria bacterium]|nr:orotidine-5'-phosphate decarboxylase [Actinomycetota bacterium]
MDKDLLKKLSPLILAMDTSSLHEAREVASKVVESVDIVKIGLQLFSSAGTGSISSFKDDGFEIFVDIKMCDIPNTVASACRVLCDYEPLMLTIHTMGGVEMMRAASIAVREHCDGLGLRKPLLVGVTVLTSIDLFALGKIGVDDSVEGQVCRLAALARDSGMDGLVCSPLEITPVRREVGEEMVLVTPGVRLRDSDRNDQLRVAAPGEAMKSGADFLVVGRPIYESEDPEGSAGRILDDIRL